MKLLKDYTEKELVKITPEEKHQMFLLECADRGVTLPTSIPKFVQKPEKREDLQPDKQVYKLSVNYSDLAYFETMEDAEKAAELFNRTAIGVGYNWGDSDKSYYEEAKQREVKIDAVMIFSADKYASLKSEIKAYNDRKSSIEKTNLTRAEILDKHQGILNEIEDAVALAEKNITRIADFKKMLKEYLKMAENDMKVAVRFLLSAHYQEICEYDDERLAEIGLTKQDIIAFEEQNQAKETVI